MTTTYNNARNNNERTTDAYTVEVHHFFSEAPIFRSSIPHPKKPVWRKMKVIHDEKSHGLNIQRNVLQHKIEFPTIWGSRSTVIPKTL